MLPCVLLGSELADPDDSSGEHALRQDGDGHLFTCGKCSMVGAKEDLCALPCKPDSPGKRRKLPGLTHTTQENINRLFGVEGVGKRCRKSSSSSSAAAQKPEVTPPQSPDDNLALALMEEELAGLLAEQRQLEVEELRQQSGKSEQEDLLQLMAEQRLLASLQEEEKALQEALLQSICGMNEHPPLDCKELMPPPPVPDRCKLTKPAEKTLSHLNTSGMGFCIIRPPTHWSCLLLLIEARTSTRYRCPLSQRL